MKFVKIVTIEDEEIYVNIDHVVSIFRDAGGHVALNIRGAESSTILDSTDLEAVIMDFNFVDES